jgi:endonuclease YncB( thermonuclease family)
LPWRFIIARRPSLSSAASSSARVLLRRLGVSRPVIAVIVAVIGAGVAYCSAGRAPNIAPTTVPTPASTGSGYSLQGRIVHVADGDTVTLLAGGAQHRIRLASIDAPEIGHGKDQPGQPFGQGARRSLESMVAGRTVTARCYEKDRYGRDVCDLPVDDGQTASRQQVAAGYAWANTVRRGEYLRDATLPDVQRAAREAGKGLWSQPGAVPPWVWRQACWKERKCDGQ